MKEVFGHAGFIVTITERTAGYLQVMGGPCIAQDPAASVFNWMVRTRQGNLVGFGWSPTLEVATRCGQETADGCPPERSVPAEPAEYEYVAEYVHPGTKKGFSE
jgi:hypothetical protein